MARTAVETGKAMPVLVGDTEDAGGAAVGVVDVPVGDVPVGEALEGAVDNGSLPLGGP